MSRIAKSMPKIMFPCLLEIHDKFIGLHVFVNVRPCISLVADLARNDPVSPERMFVCSLLYGLQWTTNLFSTEWLLSPFKSSLHR